jgi:hypothetical protein
MPPPMLRRLILICTIFALLDIVVVSLNPINSTALKLILLAGVGVAWAGLLALSWKRRPARNILILLALLPVLAVSLPGREIDPARLRDIYVRKMTGYAGTPYFWGGESARGIDCSGLPRRALRDALLTYGLRHVNGRAFRAFAEQWWFDAGAKALGEGYRGYTVSLGVEGTIRGMDYGPLAPGDLAVTSNGIHVLVYAGDGRWIQADPGIGSVVTLDGLKDQNSWFNTRVSMHRWKLLSAPETNKPQPLADKAPQPPGG